MTAFRPAGRVQGRNMDREAVVAALHRGMGNAVRDFHAWTAGGSIEDWGVESLLTASCASALAKAASKTPSGPLLTIEQTFVDLIEYSQRQPGVGRPSKAATSIKDKPGGRVDIVIWNRGNTPRAVVEIKRSDGVAGLRADAERVAAFISVAGRLYGGSIRYGALATLIHASKKGTRLQDKISTRCEAIAQVADRAGLKCRSFGPEPIHDARAEQSRSAWSQVFLLEE